MALADALRKLVDGVDLTSEEAAEALREIVGGETPPSVVAGFLVALRMKGETPAEIAGLAQTMREHAVPVRADATELVDTCGTGGDGTGTVNLSTAAAFVVAGAGVPVAKHGNRALSSKAGSADVLEALGVSIEGGPEHVVRCIDEVGIGFMFAPAFHPAMKAVMPVRRELGIRTAFNLLGPLTNPARPPYQLVGVGSASLAELVAGALAHLGVRRAIVVHGAGGADELTCVGDNLVLHVEEGRVRRDSLSPEDFGFERTPLAALAGGTAEENATRLRAVLEGEDGPLHDAVVLNAAAALLAAGAARVFAEAADRARDALRSGAAARTLERLASVPPASG